MPVSNLSRYTRLTPYRAFDNEGSGHATIPLRPQLAPVVDGAYQHVVTGVETLEYLAWRFYGVSEFWWRIADANPRIFPLDARPGASVTIPPASSFSSRLRERNFGG